MFKLPPSSTRVAKAKRRIFPVDNVKITINSAPLTAKEFEKTSENIGKCLDLIGNFNNVGSDSSTVRLTH